MKKRFLTLLTCITLSLLCIFTLTACDDNNSGDNENLGHTHTYSNEWSYDDNYHFKKATCEHSTEIKDKQEHTLSGKDCTVCDYVSTVLFGTEISSSVYEINETNLFTKIPNNQTSFSFANSINVADGASYKIYTDITCREEYCIPSYAVNNLEIGNNTYYFLVTNTNVIPQVYEVIVRRRPMYEVTFETNGGTEVQSQTVEEDSLLTKPATTTKIGYTFDCWDYNFNTPITSNKTITANWKAIFTISENTITGLTEHGKTLLEIIIPSTIDGKPITSIGSSAFDNCDFISIEIPDTIARVGDRAFRGCTSLEKVYYTGTIDEWVQIEFVFATIIHTYSNPLSYAEELYINNKLVTEINITSVTEISSGAFYDYNKLTSVTIGNGVTSIGDCAFLGCDLLTIYCETTSLPNTWNLYWNYSGCPVVWDCNNNDVATDGYIYTVIDGIRYGIKDGVATVVKQPRNITSANIPSTVTYKGITYNVTSIGNWAFSNCDSLTSIIIPNSVTSIGNWAFSNCDSLTSIIIPNSVTSIGNYAFNNCSWLTIYCKATSQPNGWSSDWNPSNRPVVWGYEHEDDHHGRPHTDRPSLIGA